ncbi:MAG: Rid family detoxifying hydrolase [Azoarcus sp.]|nr:Rid family detoxifying hydrolase [Azoarcus sp.]
MEKTIVHSPKAPAAIGTYSQAVRIGDTVYLSGQIGLDPVTMLLAEGIDAQIERVLENVKAVAEAAGGSLNEIVKVNVYLTELANFSKVNEIMSRYFAEPYPARAVIGAAALPLGALVEIETVMTVSR